MNKMWILADFENALIQLRSALSQPANSDLLRAGCIRYFEFTFELAWKAIKPHLGMPAFRNACFPSLA